MSPSRTPASGHTTPTPWTYDPNDVDWGFVRGADGMPVAHTAVSARYQWSDTGKREAPREIHANAALIVRAVNEREELIAACKLAQQFWYSDHPNDTVEGQAAKRLLDDVLAKADTP